MREGRSDGVIINNFFTLTTIIIIAATLAIYVKYFGEKKDKTPIVQKLQCQKETYTKTKVKNQKLLNKSIKALEKGYYRVEGSYLKSQQMKSNIEDIVTLDEVDSFFISSVGVKPKKDIEKFLKIKYELIEIDKKDSKNSSKLNAGTLMTSFRINSKEIFTIYSDFDFMFKNAIKDRVDCSIKVYKNHVQSN